MAAREAGEGRQVAVTRAGVRLNRRRLAELTAAIGELLRAAQDHPEPTPSRITAARTECDR